MRPRVQGHSPSCIEPHLNQPTTPCTVSVFQGFRRMRFTGAGDLAAKRRTNRSNPPGLSREDCGSCRRALAAAAATRRQPHPAVLLPKILGTARKGRCANCGVTRSGERLDSSLGQGRGACGRETSGRSPRCLLVRCALQEAAETLSAGWEGGVRAGHAVACALELHVNKEQGR
jgi:hypothetical protein